MQYHPDAGGQERLAIRREIGAGDGSHDRFGIAALRARPGKIQGDRSRGAQAHLAGFKRGLMKTAARTIFIILCSCALCFGGVQSKLDTSKIDSVLGRSGAWTGGLYVVFFPRPDLRVLLQGVRLSTAQVVSFITFMGSEDHSEMMGEICALSSEMTPALAKLRAGGFAITAAHNHFLGESPRLMFVHFMAQGQAVEMARSFRAALAVTTTPLGKPPSPGVSPEPDWARAVENALGRRGIYLSPDRTLEVDVPSAHFPAGPMDFWYESLLYFQQAPTGKIAGAGDVMVTARELNPVLSALLEHGFQIEGVHNHMIDEQPRVFFVHYWKIATPQDLADGLRATLAAVHIREK